MLVQGRQRRLGVLISALLGLQRRKEAECLLPAAWHRAGSSGAPVCLGLGEAGGVAGRHGRRGAGRAGLQRHSRRAARRGLGGQSESETHRKHYGKYKVMWAGIAKCHGQRGKCGGATNESSFGEARKTGTDKLLTTLEERNGSALAALRAGMCMHCGDMAGPQGTGQRRSQPTPPPTRSLRSCGTRGGAGAVIAAPRM